MSSARDALRAELLKTRPVKSKIITFFGQEIEIKQLTLEAVIDAASETDRQAALINTLLKYAFVPGTNELIFEQGDIDSLKQLPFGGDFVALTDAITELSNISFPMRGDGSSSMASSPGPTQSPTN